MTGPIAALIEAWRRDDVTVVLSAHIITEMERALGKPYFAQRLDPQARIMYQRLVRRRATVIPITTPVPSIVSDYDDNLVLATAESAGVVYLITGDRELLRLGAFHDITILSPRTFLELIEL